MGPLVVADGTQGQRRGHEVPELEVVIASVVGDPEHFFDEGIGSTSLNEAGRHDWIETAVKVETDKILMQAHGRG